MSAPRRERDGVAGVDRGREIRTDRPVADREIEAIVEQFLFHIEVDEVDAHVESGAVDFLRLADPVADVVRADVSSRAVDCDEMRVESGDAGEFLPVDVGRDGDLVGVVEALSLAGDVSGDLRRVVDLQGYSGIQEPTTPAAQIAEQDILRRWRTNRALRFLKLLLGDAPWPAGLDARAAGATGASAASLRPSRCAGRESKPGQRRGAGQPRSPRFRRY
jgi:hypothetical protein